ncbi:MAG: hypothetical protein QOF60_717 [Actinomycetota bacterium]|nr:hypothetical protein [Actinomycetota bacterium]
MSHMVIHGAADGQPVHHQVESLEEAARHVESLRNSGQGADARIFRMDEVKMEVKTYYRVEVAVEAPPAAPAVAPAPAPSGKAAAPVAAIVPEMPDVPAASAAVKPEPAVAGAGNGAANASANGGRFGLFGKG